MRALLACALVLASCGSTVTGTAGDASTSPDVGVDVALDVTVDVVVDARPDVSVDARADAMSGRCAWRVGAVTDLATPPSASTCTLADLAVTGDGAWALRGCEIEAGSPFILAHVIDRVSADGSAAGPVTVTTTRVSTPEIASLALDESLSRRAVLIPEGPSQQATIRLLDGDARSVGMATLGQPPMSFSLGGYRHLMANRAGFTCVAEQIRALWGVSMLQMSASGATLSAVDLGIPEFPPVPFARLALPDRSFVMAWTERDRMGGMATMRVRRHREDGTGFTNEAHALDTRPPEDVRAAVVPSGDGLMIAWESTADTLPPLRTVAVQRLTSDGAPIGEPSLLTSLGFYAGGLDAAASRGAVLVTAVTGSGVLRLVVMVLGPDGAPRGETLSVTMVSPLAPERTAARIVATSTGALVAFQRDARTVSVAPIICETGRP